jgi:hypothetical protein
MGKGGGAGTGERPHNCGCRMSFMIVLLTAITWAIKQGRMRRTERVASVGETKNEHSALVGKCEGNESL